MLGIANPNLASVDEIRNRSTRSKTDCDKCGCSHGKGDCPALAENAISVVEKTTLAKCVDHRDLTSFSLSQSQEESQDRLMVNVLTNAEYMRLTSVKMTWRT